MAAAEFKAVATSPDGSLSATHAQVEGTTMHVDTVRTQAGLAQSKPYRRSKTLESTAVAVDRLKLYRDFLKAQHDVEVEIVFERGLDKEET